MDRHPATRLWLLMKISCAGAPRGEIVLEDMAGSVAQYDQLDLLGAKVSNLKEDDILVVQVSALL